MRHALLLTTVVIGLSGCVSVKAPPTAPPKIQTEVKYQDPPKIPELDPTIKEKCPPLPLPPDRSIGTISTEDASAAYAYAACQVKQQAAVMAYETIRLAFERYEAQRKADEAAAQAKK